MNEPLNIVFIGSGAISTIIDNIPVEKEKYNNQFLSTEKEEIKFVNNILINS